MQLVDTSPEAAALRHALLTGSNELHNLSLEAGGLAGLLQLVSGSEYLDEQQRMALGVVADMAQRLKNEIEAAATRLGDALRPD